jgi:hypothetical protein
VRVGAKRSGGFALLAFVLAVSVAALGIVLGYASLLTREQADALPATQQAYLEELARRVEHIYRERATTGVGTTMQLQQWRAFGEGEDVLALVESSPRWDVQATVTEPLADAHGAPYQRVVLWLPTQSDAVNPPNLEQFQATGEWVSCTKASPCDTRALVAVDGQALQRELRMRARERLAVVAYKLQSYFKARVLQDPERSIALNYFRNPRGGSCPTTPVAPDLGCLDTYQVPSATFAQRANLTAEDLVSPWGEAVEVSNLQDSETQRAPFTMAVRAPVKGTTEYLQVFALQPM